MDVEAAAEMDVEDSKDDLLKDIVVVDVAEQAESMDTDMFSVSTLSATQILPSRALILLAMCLRNIK